MEAECMVMSKNALQLYPNFKQRLVHPSKFHEWFGTKNQSIKFDSSRFRELINLAQQDAEETFPILESFIKGWMNQAIQNIDKTKCPPRILKWGSYFLDLHISTLIPNASDSKELNELSKLEGVRYLTQDIPEAMIYDSLNFGKILIVSGFCFLLNDGVIMDRNTLLMCKDTYIARFQTLFSMINRIDDEFHTKDWDQLDKIYQLGDKMLSKYGTKAYDAIKLIEAMCSLRISELAREFRPLIPEFPAYRTHIEASVETLSQTMPITKTLHYLISNLQTPELVLTVYGSFRHWGHPYLEYLDGLKSVHRQVTMEKRIDTSYAEALASDLAFVVLKDKFKETKKWYVKKNLLSQISDCGVKEHIKNDTWPTPNQIKDFGDQWHKLPLDKCFEVPDVLDPSIIYSDKSHSMNREEVIKHIKYDPNHPIPSKKVLKTLLNTPATNWREFLHTIDREGLRITR